MIELVYAPFAEFDRVRALHAPAVDRARIFANLCRLNTLYMIKRAGSGHIGSSFSSLDIVSWLYLEEMRAGEENRDDASESALYFSSKGHDAPGLYAVLLGMGYLEFDLIHALRRIRGLPGHPDVQTPHIPANTGSLGMGISKAKGMALANRLTGRSERIFVMTGDGELQEGQIWESLQPAANLGLGEITVIVDHNKLQSDTFVANVSHLGDLERKFASFGWHVVRCDGHDLAALQKVFASLQQHPRQPKVIIADTIKGRGVSFMEHTALKPSEELYRFHSGAPSDEIYLKASQQLMSTINAQLQALSVKAIRVESVGHDSPQPSRTAQRLVAAYSRALVAAGEKNKDIVALDGDLMLDCGLIPFRDRFPDRFFECGIAEQDMVSQASGMALKGLLPVVHSFACFLSSRPNEHFFNNATERTRIVYVGSLAGLVPGGPGHSHQCVRDLSALRGVPDLVLVEPSCEAEVGMAAEYCFHKASSSCYLRLASIPCEIPYNLPNGYRFAEGRGVALTEGRDAVLFGYGPVLLAEAYKAARRLAQLGVGLKVVNLPWLNRIDVEWLARAIAGVRSIFTLDNHFLEGGQGQFLAATLAEHGLLGGRAVQCLGVTRIPECGRNDEVLAAHGLDADHISQTVKGSMRQAA